LVKGRDWGSKKKKKKRGKGGRKSFCERIKGVQKIARKNKKKKKKNKCHHGERGEGSTNKPGQREEKDIGTSKTRDQNAKEKEEVVRQTHVRAGFHGRLWKVKENGWGNLNPRATRRGGGKGEGKWAVVLRSLEIGGKTRDRQKNAAGKDAKGHRGEKKEPHLTLIAREWKH